MNKRKIQLICPLAFGFLPITEPALDKAQKSLRVGHPIALPAIPGLGSELLQPQIRLSPLSQQCGDSTSWAPGQGAIGPNPRSQPGAWNSS